MVIYHLANQITDCCHVLSAKIVQENAHLFKTARKKQSFSFINAKGKGRRMPVLTEEDNTAFLFLFS
jgi:hypothetical protein